MWRMVHGRCFQRVGLKRKKKRKKRRGWGGWRVFIFGYGFTSIWGGKKKKKKSQYVRILLFFVQLWVFHSWTMFSSATPYKNQHYSELKKDCIKSKKLFEDPEFPCVDASLYFRKPPPGMVQWKRPGVSAVSPLGKFWGRGGGCQERTIQTYWKRFHSLFLDQVILCT